MKVLGFESSCDETGVALVEAEAQGAPRLLAEALHSQVEMHAAFGGVVPELASRDHIRRVLPLARQVLAQAGCSLSDVDLIAYTRGPGLSGALLVGCAQALALVPGTSRSGITITAALLLGFARPAAARFSFLLAIPIGLVLALKQIADALGGMPLGVPPGALAIGIAVSSVSAVAGYAVIAFLLDWVRKRSLAPFAWYRLALGVVLLVVFAR